LRSRCRRRAIFFSMVALAPWCGLASAWKCACPIDSSTLGLHNNPQTATHTTRSSTSALTCGALHKRLTGGLLVRFSQQYARPGCLEEPLLRLPLARCLHHAQETNLRSRYSLEGRPAHSLARLASFA